MPFCTPRIVFPPILAALGTVQPQAQGQGLTSLGLQQQEEGSGEDAEGCPGGFVLGKSGCWGGTRTLPQLLFHFDLSVCWGSQLLEVKERNNAHEAENSTDY